VFERVNLDKGGGEFLGRNREWKVMGEKTRFSNSAGELQGGWSVPGKIKTFYTDLMHFWHGVLGKKATVKWGGMG